MYVSGRLFKKASHSNKTVGICSYDNLLHFKSLINKSFTLFTILSKNSPYHGARGKLKCHSINLLATKFLLSSKTKFDPLSDITLSGQPLREINRLKLWMKNAKFMLGTKSKQMALLATHVNNVTHVLCMLFSTKEMFQTKTGPKLSIPAVKNERKLLSLSGIRGDDGGYL